MSFEEFFLDHYGDMVRSLALAFGDRGAAEDAVQEAFAKAHRSWRRVEAMERPHGWLYVVACDAARRARARTPDPEIETQADLDPIGPVASSIDLHDALRRLTARQRAVLVLRYLVDLPIDEIARALGCAPGTVKATLHQSLQRLRIDMEDREDTRER